MKTIRDGWMAALDEMRRPGWYERLTQARREMAEKRGRNLDAIAPELGLEGTQRTSDRSKARR